MTLDIAAIEARHHSPGSDMCDGPWPCDARKLLDDRDAYRQECLAAAVADVNAERARIAEAVKGLAQAVMNQWPDDTIYRSAVLAIVEGET